MAITEATLRDYVQQVGDIGGSANIPWASHWRFDHLGTFEVLWDKKVQLYNSSNVFSIFPTDYYKLYEKKNTNR